MSAWSTRTRKRFSRLLLIAFTRSLSLAARLLPYRAAVAAGGLLGSLVYFLLPRERKRTLCHLAIAYQDQDRQWLVRTARGTFVYLGKALLEAVSMDKQRLGAQVIFQGFDNLTQAMKQGKGVVYFTGHIGNWELMAGAVAQTYPVSVVAAPIEPAPLNDMIVGLRASLGVRTILRGQPGAAKELCGSPFDPVTVNGKPHVPRQGNNSYIFPGVGLGAIASGAKLVTDDIFMGAAHALAHTVTEADLAQGSLYPALQRIREVSAEIATAVAQNAYKNGLAQGAAPANLAAHVKAQMFDPQYKSYV